jgi:putative transposase
MAGMTYHITSRGNGRMDIYLDDDDRIKFIDLLSKVVMTKEVLCHAYCLMGNHYHLVVTTTKPNVSSVVHQLNGEYARWWNDRHGHVGHVFQGRFNGQLVQDETYMLTASTYIVLNPVRARIVEWADQWPWSSYRATAGLVTVPSFLAPEGVWRHLGQEPTLRYREHVAAALGVELPEKPILGDEEFQRRFTPWHEAASREVPLREKRVRPPLDEFFAGVGSRPARDQAVLKARSAGYQNKEIAQALNLHKTTISSLLKRYQATKSRKGEVSPAMLPEAETLLAQT